MSLELETLLVRVQADAKQYHAEMDRVVKKANDSMRSVVAAHRLASAQCQAEMKMLARATNSASVSAATLQGQTQATTRAIQQQSTEVRRLANTYTAVARSATAAAIAAARVATAGASRFFGGGGRSVAGGATSMLRSAGAGISRIGRTASMAITAPVTALGAASVGSFAAFDDSINRASATLGNVSNEMRSLMVRNAKDIASHGIISANELAKGYLNLAQAGYNAKESIGALLPIQRFATAASMDMAKATEILVQSTYALGLREADAIKNTANLKRVADVIVKTANLTTSTVEDISRAVAGKAGAAFRILGKDVTELAGMIGAYAQVGVKAELASERIWMSVRDLASASMKAAGAWRALGIQVYTGSGAMRNVADIIGDIENAMKGLSDQQKRAMLTALKLPDRSSAAILQLVGLSGAMRNYEREAALATNESHRMARLIESSFLSSLKMLWNQIVVTSIEIGESLAPAIREASRYIEIATQWFRTLSPEIKRASVVAAGLLATVGPLSLALGSMVTSAAMTTAGIAALVAAGPASIAVLGGMSAAVVAGAGYLGFFAKNLALVATKAADPSAYRKLSTEIERATRTGSQLFEAFAAWTRETLGPMLAEASAMAGKEAGEAFIKAFTAAMTPSAIGSQEEERIKRINRHIKLLESQPEYTRVRNDPVIDRLKKERAELQAIIDAAKEAEKPKRPTGPNLLKTMGDIISHEYGGIMRPHSAASVGFGAGAVPYGAGLSFVGRSTRPDVVAGGKTPAEIAGALADLSPEAKEIAKIADREKKKADTESERLRKVLEHEADRIKEAVKTPEEKVESALKEATDLAKKNLLSAADLAKYKSKLYEELDKDLAKHTRSTGTVAHSALLDPSTMGASVSGMVAMGSMLDARAERVHAAKAAREAAALASVKPLGRIIRAATPDEMVAGHRGRKAPAEFGVPEDDYLGTRLPRPTRTIAELYGPHVPGIDAITARAQAMHDADFSPKLVSSGPPSETKSVADKLVTTLEKTNEALKENTAATQKSESLVLDAANF